MPYFLSRTRMFVLNDVMNDDTKYFKWPTASINVAQVHVSVGTKYDLFTLLPINAVPNMSFQYSAEYE